MPIIFEYYDQFCFCWCCEWWWFLLQHSPNWSPSIMKLSLVYSKSRDFGATRGRDNTGKDIKSIQSRSSTSVLGTKTNYPGVWKFELLNEHLVWPCPHHYRSETSKLYFIHLTATYQMQSNLRMRSRKLFVIVSAQPLVSNQCRIKYYRLIL